MAKTQRDPETTHQSDDRGASICEEETLIQVNNSAKLYLRTRKLQSLLTSYLFILRCFVAAVEPLKTQVLVLLKETLKLILLGEQKNSQKENSV